RRRAARAVGVGAHVVTRDADRAQKRAAVVVQEDALAGNIAGAVVVADRVAGDSHGVGASAGRVVYVDGVAADGVEHVGQNRDVAGRTIDFDAVAAHTGDRIAHHGGAEHRIDQDTVAAKTSDAVVGDQHAIQGQSAAVDEDADAVAAADPARADHSVA